jgi:hypothetical protein
VGFLLHLFLEHAPTIFFHYLLTFLPIHLCWILSNFYVIFSNFFIYTS